MAQALDEFTARVANLRRDVNFISLAANFRPQVYRVLDREAEPEAIDLAERFADVKDSEVSAIYGPLVVRLSAIIERYLRALIEECVSAWAIKAGSSERVPATLANRNIVLTGRLLASSDQPRDHLKLDVPTLIKNLASCSGSRRDFVLNREAFSTLIIGITPETVEASLKAVKVGDCWDAICADPDLKRSLQKTRTVDAAKATKLRLKELSRWRNNWAHGGDEEISLTDQELLDACDFATYFVKALDTVVTTRIRMAQLN
jgi:hypothetical protein